MHVEAELLYSLEVPVVLLPSAGMAWSRDHKLAYVAHQGIHASLFYLDPENTNVEPNSRKAFFSNVVDLVDSVDVGYDREALRQEHSYHQNQDLYLDHILSRSLDAPASREFRRILWVSFGHSSLLLALNNNFSLYLLDLDWNKSSVISNLTKELNEYCIYGGWKDLSSSGKPIDKYGRRMYFLATANFAWGELAEGFNVLVTSQKSGHLIVWKLNLDEIVPCVILDSNIGPASAILWHKRRKYSSLVFVGFTCGSVQVYQLDYLEGELIFFPYFSIWEERDGVQVNDLVVVEDGIESENILKVAVCKNYFLLTFNVALSVEPVSVTRDFFHRFGNESITGLAKGRDQLFLSTDAGNILYFDGKSLERLSFVFQERRPGTHFGRLVTSPNRAMFALFSCNEGFDRNKRLNTVSLIHFFSPLAPKELRLELERPVGRLLDVEDLLEACRILYHRSTFDCSVLLDGAGSLGVRWFVASMIFSAERSDVNQRLLDAVYLEIFARHALEYFGNVDLEIEYRQSLERFLLRKALSSPTLSQKLRSQVSDVASGMLEVEPDGPTCNVCGEKFPESDFVSTAECVNGHKFGVCCLTLAPAQCVALYSCEACNSLFSVKDGCFKVCTICQKDL